MRHVHRSQVQLGRRTIVVESGLGDSAQREVITSYTENDMTAEQKRVPVVGASTESNVRDEVSATRHVSASHLASVNELLSEAADDHAEIETAKNLSAKANNLEPQGILLSFCLDTPPAADRFSERSVPLAWLNALRNADNLARSTGKAFGGVVVEQVIVHGENLAAHLLGGACGTRACIVDSSRELAETTILARLERITCAH